jgi:hypothetical protein
MRIHSNQADNFDFIQVVSLNRGTISSWPARIPKPKMRRRLTNLVELGTGPVPGLPGYIVTIGRQKGAAMAGVRCRNEEILTCGIALHPAGAKNIWVWLLDFRAYLLGRNVCESDYANFLKPEALPWIGEMVHPDISPISLAHAAKLRIFLQELTFVLWQLFGNGAPPAQLGPGYRQSPNF